MTRELDPSRILQVGFGFWASKTLLSAVELGLFSALAAAPLTASEIGERLGLHPRAISDFLDALLALGFLERAGDGPSSRYSNTPETGVFLDRQNPAYIGGILEMANARLYPHWANLTAALRSGERQSESAAAGGDFFQAIYSDERRLEQFLAGMQGAQLGNFRALLRQVDLSSCRVLADVGGAGGTLSILAAREHPELRCISFDLPAVTTIARRNVERAGLLDRIELCAGDFFRDPLPRADVITMGNVLHDWGEAGKQTLIGKAYAALPAGGRLIAIENVIDDARRSNAFGLLMSLNMLVELPDGFDYTGAQFDAWCRSAGFSRTEIVPLMGPSSAAIAYK